MISPTLIAQSLHKSFENQPVVVDVSFRVMPGHILTLLGPSGCGKTTTLRLLAGFEQLDSGSIEIDAQLVADDRRHLPPEKRQAGMVFQDYAIFPHLSVGKNVGFGLGKRSDAQVAEMLEFVGLDGQGDRMPHELSGGQQQRVALARALVMGPGLVLADEPTGNLDPATADGVLETLMDLNVQLSSTLVVVTHSRALAERFPRRLMLEEGQFGEW